METWVLIFWLIATNMVSDPRGAAATTAEFTSSATCNAAAEAIRSANASKHTVYAVCTKK